MLQDAENTQCGPLDHIFKDSGASEFFNQSTIKSWIKMGCFTRPHNRRLSLMPKALKYWFLEQWAEASIV